MKIALVHDELVRKGGSEQVLLSFHNAFPDAPIYTLSYNAETTYPQFKDCKIVTSFFGKVIKTEKNLKRFFFPFGVWSMSRLSLKGYDVILQSTTHCSKYVKTDPGALIITYCHTPFRLVWRPNSYLEIENANVIKSFMYRTVINILKKIDNAYAKKTDWFIANASEVVERIKLAYHPKNKITVINPSVKCENFYISKEVGDYFLVVSRLEPYKRVDLVVEAFNQMKDKKLIVVGKGSMEKDLKEMAGENTTFLSNLDAVQLSEVYSKCKAFIFPQLEDYGIAPLEANASGRPVIAFGKGGIRDTMIPFTANSANATAVFFYEQTVVALKKAISDFETISFDPNFLRKHAESFDDNVFVEKIKSFVLEKYTQTKVNKARALCIGLLYCFSQFL